MAGSTPIFGFPYPESSDLVANYPALGEQLAEDIETVLASGFGKVLQVVRDTDTTDRITNSTSATDVTGMSVTITPQKNTSGILLILMARARNDFNNASLAYTFVQITDSSNNVISGVENHRLGTTGYSVPGASSFTIPITLIAYATPATTSAVTYKARFYTADASTYITLQNSAATGQLYAIEVAA